MTRRFALGIDLGTTNCSLAAIDLQNANLKLLMIPQWEGENQIVAAERLPSFVSILPKNQQKKGGRASPLNESEALAHIVGREARDRALTEPDRVIHSAKSWISSGSLANRSGKILPWGSSTVDEKLSPAEVQSLYLKHIKDAWNQARPDAPFDQQAVVITVPASFDEVAQRLTLEAARLASYPADITLLEEPQAAFYDWHQSSAQDRNGQILVCDVGGGTSDFTLLRCKGEDTERLRVSDHILLGGDNIDLAIAHRIARKLSEEELPRAAWTLLLAQTRRLKEEALANLKPGDFHISIPKNSLKLFGDYYSATISADEIRELVLDGFFPVVSADATVHRDRQSPLQSMGLPYAQDTAITRHIAEFLQGETIDALLCVGGSLLPELLQDRLLKIISAWQSAPVEKLGAGVSDLAVARGAARFAFLREKAQKLVKTAYPRTLLIELESQDQKRYLTLIPRGHPRLQASRLTIPGLHLRVGSSVRFQLFSSLEAAPNAAVEAKGCHWQSLPPLETRIPKQTGKRVESLPVSLEATVRETGVLEILCRGEDETWALDFPLEARADAPQTASLQKIQDVTEPVKLIKSAFAKGGNSKDLNKDLEKILGSREAWSFGTLRALWPALEAVMFQRQSDEASWFHLAGYTLRPGFGAAGDADRIASLMRIYDESFRRVDENPRLADQWCILWRRVAAGLPAAFQLRLFERYMPTLRKDKNASPEIIRMLASMERLDPTRKTQLGRLLATQLQEGIKVNVDARVWALARVSSRVPLYAGLDAILPPATIEEWAELLETSPLRARCNLFYASAGRLTGEKLLDLDPRYRALFQERLHDADESLKAPVFAASALDARWQQQMFGESLPSGFVIF